METREVFDCICKIQTRSNEIYHLASRILKESATPLNKHIALLIQHISTLLFDCWDSFDLDGDETRS